MKRYYQAILRFIIVLAVSQLFAATSLAQKSGLDPLLQKALDHYHQTSAEAQSYTYTEKYQNINYKSDGSETLNFSDTYDIIFLEGAPYKKHTFHNDSPLPDKEQKKEDAKLTDVAAARRNHREKKGLFNATFHFELPLDQLATRFDVTALKSDQIDGRDNAVFYAVPRASLAPKQAARDNVAYEIKFWVDQQDGMFRKIEAKVVGEGMRYERDSLVSYGWQKINGEAWLPVRSSFKGKVRYMMRDVPAAAVYNYFGYKKYRVDTTVVPS